jgi:O-acetyl-ADP-ribose deacetylase (regulator of RNase III)
MGVEDRIDVIQGDITQQKVDAVVNAANSRLAGGGGVDGAIHRAGGSAITDACKQLGGCPTGDARITTAGKMPARYVIHAVGPVYHGGGQGESEKLAGAYRRSLELAREHDCATVAFPAISCGAYGYPLGEGARIAIHTVREFLEAHDTPEQVRFVMFTEDTYHAFKDALED